MAVSPADLRRTLASRALGDRHAAEMRRRAAVEGARGLLVRMRDEGLIEDAWLIGSAAWGGFGERSDLDVVVKGLDPRRVADAADQLMRMTSTSVDLLRYEELAASFRARVDRDGERL